VEYCLSVDVAKGKSMFLLADADGEILYGPRVSVHTRSTFEEIHQTILGCDLEAKPTVILESTSIYHLPVERFFKDLGYSVILLNPIISKEHKKNLRRTKTDALDCLNLAHIYFQKTYNLQHPTQEVYVEMQSLSRQINHLQEVLTQLKNRFRQCLDLTFPEYQEIFASASLFSATALHFIYEYPHAGLIREKRVDALAHCLGAVHDRHPNFYRRKAEKIKLMAKNSFGAVDKGSVSVASVRQQIRMIQFTQNELSLCRSQLDEMAKQVDLFANFVSIDYIGEATAALLLAELKDIRRFHNVKELTAYCGLDPTIIQSGKSVNFHGPISKRGNRLARKYLYNACAIIIRGASRSQPAHPILTYYRKKRSEGKHHYAAVVACTTKLLRILFALSKANTLYT
jgi:transposase